MTKTVEDGNRVTLHYKGTLDDGTQFDSSHDRNEAMTVVIGDGGLIPGFNDALVGMTEGESKTFTLSAEEAYGPVDPAAVTSLEKNVFPDDFDFKEGEIIPLSNPQTGQNFVATITEVHDTTVMADFNHPMAGKDLTFDVDIVRVRDNDDSDLEEEGDDDET
jgi:FKBP-type peptidyl-prolyl cis-trans isomerase 2